MINKKSHVFIGMSGGIDSSAAVTLLLEQGYQVTGVTFVGLGKEETPYTRGKNSFLGKDSRKCCSAEEVIVAKQVCFSLGISHITLDLAETFKKQVREPFVQSYLAGETPNPCMLCNRHVKLGALVDFALKNGADYIAMGHYTGVECVDGEYLLKAGKDKNKDQSYFLALLKPEILPFLIFPLADKEKDEIRAIINSNQKLPLAGNKIESQDVCFVDNDYRDYLKQQGVQPYKGEMVLDSKTIGSHEGTAFYSLGQRRGLEISLGKRVFIRSIDTKNNKIILGQKPKSKIFIVSDLNIFSRKLQEGEWEIQIRYRSPRILGKIVFLDQNTIQVELSQAQEIVAPGQFAVFYKDNYIYGAGKIKEVELLEESKDQ
ncbi:MAG: tRNA 2-thiouridine(34) synthase MnmA [Brevinema sp.]